MNDSTKDALSHYVRGNGEAVELGPNTQGAIINSEDQQYRLYRIKNGLTTSDTGVYGVDVEFDSWDTYHVGDTPVHYSTESGGRQLHNDLYK